MSGWSASLTGPKIGCQGEGMPEWGLVLERAPQKGAEGRGWAGLELGCARSSRGRGAERGPIPVPGQHSQQAPAFHSRSENAFLLPGITQRLPRATQADPRKRITGLLVDWERGEDGWRNLLSHPSGREARGPRRVPSRAQSHG